MYFVYYLFIIWLYYGADPRTKLFSQMANDNYELVWSDEFNSTGLPDTRKWRFETGFVRNNEAQWYQKENAVNHQTRYDQFQLIFSQLL